jgi:hypothetical protein
MPSCLMRLVLRMNPRRIDGKGSLRAALGQMGLPQGHAAPLASCSVAVFGAPELPLESDQFMILFPELPQRAY